MKRNPLFKIRSTVSALIFCIGCTALNTSSPLSIPAPPTLPPVLPTQPRNDTPVANVATVNSVQIRVRESFPVQVQAIAQGNLPDSCTTMDIVRHTRDGNTFNIALTTRRPAGVMCAQVLIPFEQVIVLDVSGLPKGKYDVVINNANASFELTTDNALATPANLTTKKIVGEFVTFDVPQSWNPTKQPLVPGAVFEDWQLGIPGVTSDQSLGFSSVAFNQLRPNDVVSETGITIGGKRGVKWIRQGMNYVSYDYYTIGRNDQGSFGVHVTVSQKNKELEAQLDRLVALIVFQ